ncbi:MAG TPA: sulfate ABC transporter substrate-binding protein [Dongiaceae bacterium]|jgi:sulfate transport system substrate-binding protein|nr:sulfate ABC transporter substrate-binding protein [Dongiaceae bacterium]
MIRQWLVSLTMIVTFGQALAEEATLLNVSYDPTREFYRQYNRAFADYWQKTNGQSVAINTSHGGSGKQARAVIDGLEADIVTLALAYDIDQIAAAGLLAKDWQNRLPGKSTPYNSVIVFLVHKGNPKNIHDWNDLVRPDIQVITPNPKTSGGARWNYLAAWGWALKHNGNDAAKAKEFVGELYKHVPVLDTGARGSTTTFAKNQIGDVLIAWENEALLSLKEFPDQFEIVSPSLTIRAEPPVALVDRVVDKHQTRAIAEAYLKYLYSPTGQEIAAQNFLRPTDPATGGKYAAQFPNVPTFTIDEVFGGWTKAQKDHFADGGSFDQVYHPGGQ